MAEQKLADDFAASLGLRFAGPGEVRLQVGPRHVNGIGKLLGPVSFALVDYAMTGAAVEAAAEDELVITVNIAINFVDSVERGEVSCSARVERRTRTIASLSAEIRDESGRVLITALGTFAIRPVRRPPG